MTYKVKLGVIVHHQVEVDVDADDVVSAMNTAMDCYNKNLLPPIQVKYTTSPAIISVSKKA